MPEYAIGIDLGTSTSIVSVMKEGRPYSIPDPLTKTPIVPSIVALSRRGELVVGEAALDSGAKPKDLIREAKRDMGTDVTYTLGEHQLRPEEVSSLVLRKMKDVAESFLGEPIHRAVITVPAYFTDIERRATMNAATLAGLDVIRLINEPTAAAMAFGIDRLEEEDTLLVFDMGGGTLDVTILEMIGGVLDVKASDGDKYLGGKDIDSLVMEEAEREFAAKHAKAQTSDQSREGLKRAAEGAKKRLSEVQTTDLVVQNFAIVDGAPVDLDIAPTRSQLSELIQSLVERALACVEKALKKAGMTRDQVGRVLLVGGSTYVPRIEEAVLNYLVKPKVSGVNADLAVSQGAAISAALALGQLDEERSIVVQDAATHGLGILVVEDVGNQEMLVYSELIRPNTPVPYHTKQEYALRRPDQDTMDVPVVQDVSGKAVLASEVEHTGASAVIKDIPAALYGTPHKVEVEFSYDQNHIAQLTAKVVGTGKQTTIELRPSAILAGGSLSDAGARIESLWSKSPLASRHQSIIKRAETVLQSKPANAEMIEAAVVELKVKVSENDADAAQAARDRLTDLLAGV